MSDVFISRGNIKVKFPIFNLPAQATCPGKTPICEKDCYAMKAQRQYPGARAARQRNYEASQKSDFVDKVNKWFKSKRKSVNYFRIHESGDFYNQEYLDKWIEIARAQPKTKFLAYTKSFHLDYSNCPDNMIIYWSIMPDTDMTTVPKDSTYRAFACFEKVKGDVALAFQCKGLKCHECMHCFIGRGDVHFPKH